jgi:hypothetical protein
MKKRYSLFVLLFSFLFLSTSYSQLLVENFDYPAGDTLTNHGWTAHSGAGSQPITVNSTGLEYSGYVSSGIGLAALLDNTGEDINRTFTTQTSGFVYYSFLVNVQTAVAGYFTHLGTGATTFAARVFVQPSVTAGKINFGISNSSTAVYGTTDFDPLTTYLLIVKYEVAAPTSNVSLWVVPSGIPASEVDAGTPEVTTTTGTGLASIDGVYLRQYNASQNVVVDGIRVATSWGEAVLGSAPSPTLTVDPTSLSNFTYVEGAGPSTSQSYTLSGSDLTPSDSVITVAGSTNYEVSTDNTTFSDTVKVDYTGDALADTTIYVRLKAGLTAGDYNSEVISNVGGGATQQDVTANGTVTSIPSLSGDYYIGAPGTGPSGSDPQFATLRDAFEVINNSPFSGNCTFYITSDIEETFTPTVGYGLGLAANPDPYTITFKPYTGVQPVITLDYPTDGTSGPSGALIIGIPMDNNIAWADMRTTKNIVIDGSNTVGGTTRDLTLQSAPTAHRNAMTVVVVGDVSNLTIKNTNIYYKVQTVSTSGNLFIGAVQIRSRNEGSKDYVPHDLIFENNHLNANFDGNAQNSQGYGLYQSGTPIPATYPYNITLKNNIIEGKRRAISLYRAGSHEIFGNEIILNQNIAANTTNEAIYAVDVDTNSVVNIYNNKITKVSSMTNAANNGNTAISIESFGTYNVYNNMISGFELTAANPVAYVRGIKNSSATATLNAVFNTIYMTDLEDIGTGNVAYSGIYVNNGINNIGDNIVVSAEKDFSSYCFYREGSAGTITSSYNDLYPNTAGVVGQWDTVTTATLADWQTASGQDAYSVSKEVFFVSDNDLHLTGSSIGDVSLAGIGVAGLTTDIDGDTRSASSPYMGADESSVKLEPTITIAEAISDLNHDFVPDRVGQTVTVQGVVFSPNYQTVNNSFYISDGTAGTDIFMYAPPLYTWSLGDELKITGVVTQYNGMSEIVVADSTGWIFMSSGNPTSDTAKITLAEFKANPELYEGSLVKFNALTLVSGTWPASGSSANLSLSDGVDTVVFRIDSDTDIDGSPEPSWPADVVGIGSQFDNSAPYNSGYQIFPRYITDFTSVTSVENENTMVTQYELAQNYPNPFNPSTIIKYSIPVDSKVTISVYSITGELVKELVNSNMSAGSYSVNFDGSRLASGVYIYRIIAGKFMETKKMMLLK